MPELKNSNNFRGVELDSSQLILKWTMAFYHL